MSARKGSIGIPRIISIISYPDAPTMIRPATPTAVAIQTLETVLPALLQFQYITKRTLVIMVKNRLIAVFNWNEKKPTFRKKET
jgi:hypothetical protein